MEASPLKSGRMMYQQAPMLERGLAMSLLTLFHTKKVYSFPSNKYIHLYLRIGKTPYTHIVKASLRGKWQSMD
jgi:hypothetical protein